MRLRSGVLILVVAGAAGCGKNQLGEACANDGDCASGLYCEARVVGEGANQALLHRCAEQPCTSDDDCGEDRRCCFDAAAAGNRCRHPSVCGGAGGDGTEGIGDPCQTSLDCQGDLECWGCGQDGMTRICVSRIDPPADCEDPRGGGGGGGGEGEAEAEAEGEGEGEVNACAPENLTGGAGCNPLTAQDWRLQDGANAVGAAVCQKANPECTTFQGCFFDPEPGAANFTNSYCAVPTNLGITAQPCGAGPSGTSGDPVQTICSPGFFCVPAGLNGLNFPTCCPFCPPSGDAALDCPPNHVCCEVQMLPRDQAWLCLAGNACPPAGG